MAMLRGQPDLQKLVAETTGQAGGLRLESGRRQARPVAASALRQPFGPNVGLRLDASAEPQPPRRHPGYTGPWVGSHLGHGW